MKIVRRESQLHVLDSEQNPLEQQNLDLRAQHMFHADQAKTENTGNGKPCKCRKYTNVGSNADLISF